MNTDSTSSSNKERPGSTISGWPMLLVTLLLKAGGITLIVRAIILANQDQMFGGMLVTGILAFVSSFISWAGFF
ncbi:MAG TPA: hypothetical protein VLD18_11880, partial [Verrucomicrobiae bacterium]|nr:hypothetical protein [Verrucomicrobiae bacterium]